MLEVASKWFGFTKDDRMTVHIGDGIEFIYQQAQNINIKSSGKYLCTYNTVKHKFLTGQHIDGCTSI